MRADVTARERADDYHVVSLEPLVRMTLDALHDKDRTHLRDMISLGLIDISRLPRCILEHAARLQQLLDDPDGWVGQPRRNPRATSVGS